MMKLNKEAYLKIKQNILNTWPDWKIKLANDEVIISKNSQKLERKSKDD